MTKRIFAALLPLLIASVACFASTAETTSPMQIKLHVGQRSHVGNLTLEFVAVVQDSRCPVNVQCITAGTAKVQIKIKTDERWTTLELDTSNQPVVYAGKEIRLLEILPRPTEGVTTKQTDYVAAFSIGDPSSTPTPNQVGPPEQS